MFGLGVLQLLFCSTAAFVFCGVAGQRSRSWLPLAMEVNGLAKTWEANEVVRDQVRRLRKLFTYPASQRYCEPTRCNATANSQVLLPALKILGTTSKWALPHIDPLQVQVAMLFSKLGVPTEDQQVYTCSIECKKLLGFVKRKAVRKEVTKACEFLNKYVIRNVPSFLVRNCYCKRVGLDKKAKISILG